MTHTALCVAVTEPDDTSTAVYDSLADFEAYATHLADALSRLGYDVNDPADTRRWTADQIADRIDTALGHSTNDAMRVVHVLGHGTLSHGSLRIVGADGKTIPRCDVDLWLRQIEDEENPGPLTLFILDTCYSGAVTRHSWNVQLRASHRRGWVLAASSPSRSAYDGRLTRAVAEVLRKLADGTLGVDPSAAILPWTVFRDRVIEDVERQQAGELEQEVHSTLLDRTVNPPFFPNPAYTPPTELALLAQGQEGSLASILESVIDISHFAERASGRRRVLSNGEVGAFTGRTSQLLELTSWIDFTPENDNVRVVTGSPGSGKSALVGLLLCATHTELREPTRSVWEGRAVHLPSPTSDVVGIHARAESLEGVIASIGAQLQLSMPEEGWSSASLSASMESSNLRPLIFVDAVDEAASVRGVLQVLQSLASLKDSSGQAMVRLVVGARSGENWEEIEDWVSSLRPEQVIDLDDTPRAILVQDVTSYLATVLPPGPLVAKAAIQSAEVIVDGQQGTEWGAFLVASLFANVLLVNMELSSDSDVERMLSKVPRTLPEVLELDLATREDAHLCRAVLGSLAWAKGAGMPLRILQVVARGLLPDPDEVDDDELLRALSEMRFYARAVPSSTGATLFRLFHQGLSDFVRSQSQDAPGLIMDALLADRPRRGTQRRWLRAEAYLKRYAFEHANDAQRYGDLLADIDFVVNAEGRAISKQLARLRHPSRYFALAQTVPPGSRAEAVLGLCTRMSYNGTLSDFPAKRAKAMRKLAKKAARPDIVEMIDELYFVAGE